MAKAVSDFLVVSDIDGTLLEAGFGVPKDNIDAVDEFISRKGRFTVCTSRGIESVSKFGACITLTAPAILYNGAMIYDYRKNKILYERLLGSETREIVQDVLSKYPNVGCGAFSRAKLYVFKMNKEMFDYVNLEHISFVVSDIDKTPDNWNKISICGEEKDISEIAQYIQGRKRTAEVFQAVDVISTGKNVCELIPEGVDKGEGLLRLCEIVNVTKDNVVAIGNDFEDMPMFLNAGISVAVGDAPPEVRKSVEIVVKSCLHGGVAQILRSLESMLDGFEQIRLEM